MLQIAVTKDFGEGEETVVITYGQMGYSYPGNTLPHPVAKDVEDSFVGASMFGWDAPIADRAHEWVADQDSGDSYPSYERLDNFDPAGH